VYAAAALLAHPQVLGWASEQYDTGARVERSGVGRQRTRSETMQRGAERARKRAEEWSTAKKAGKEPGLLPVARGF
jgi:hypothetical protein